MSPVSSLSIRCRTDLSSTKNNVVVSSDKRATICDFGGARLLQATRTLGQNAPGCRGTVQFNAPELLDPEAGQITHSKASDVWAYGMTVFVSLIPFKSGDKLSD